ncbi:MAG: glycosyltransferase family 39 protein [Chloroflexota bacterium]
MPLDERTARPTLISARSIRAGLNSLLGRDIVVLGVILVIAAATRFIGLAGRGDFDSDQGHDMLTLVRLVRDGQFPLLGPPTSIGDFHHGAAYYYLLAPFAWLSGADRAIGVMAGIAGFGVAAVGVTWWLGRSIGGRAVGAMAGLLLAISPAAIEESTFIWNPNPIPFFAATSLAVAWRAKQTGRAAWWAVSVATAGMVVQLHVLGIVFLPAIVAFLVVDAFRAFRAGERARVRAAMRGLGAGLLIVALLFVPLLIHELQTGFLETQRFLAYLSTPGGHGTLDPAGRLLFAGLRVVGWPLIGLVTSAPVASVLVVSLTVVLGAWLMLAGRGEDRFAARWLGLTIAWGIVALSVLAPSLQTVVAGLPNDHYHAFLDPVVVILVALALRAIGSGSGLDPAVDRVARGLVIGVLTALVVFDVGRWPPTTQVNGGWPLARDAGARIVRLEPGATVDVRSLPAFKTGEGIGYPIEVAGGSADIAMDETDARAPLRAGSTLVIVCDRLFETVIGDPCGGPAEDRYLRELLGDGADRDGNAGDAAPALIDRFDASPRTSISVYRP